MRLRVRVEVLVRARAVRRREPEFNALLKRSNRGQ
jgi:hypothetical protein